VLRSSWKLAILFSLGLALLLGVAWCAMRPLDSRIALAQNGAPYAAPAPARYAGAIEQANSVAQEMMARGLPGMAVAVAVDGEIAWSQGYGYADVENRVPVWPTTKFRIGSVSKPLTAAALMTLYEQGKVDLDAPVQKYVPSFPEKDAVVTTRQLAGHLAGIRHYRGDEFLLNRRYDSVLESLDIFKDDPLVEAPGTKFLYSSYGWNLLSAVVEGAAGKDFLSYMDEAVFGPLGMRDTVADKNSEIIERRTRFYGRSEDGRLMNAPAVDNSYKWAGGGFLSSVEDLVRFGSAHLEPGFLKQETLKLLFTSQRTSDGKETGYGIGWSVEPDNQGRRRIRHGGGSVGGTAALVIYPDEKIVVAVLTNMTRAPLPGADVQKIAEAFMK